MTHPAAQILFHAQLLGKSPLRRAVLPPGRQVLRLVSPDGVTYALPVELRAGGDTVLEVSLSSLSRAEAPPSGDAN